MVVLTSPWLGRFRLGLIVGAMLIAQPAVSQEIVTFDCAGGQTVTHEMSPASESVRFRSSSCLCSTDPEVAKQRLVRLLKQSSAERRSALEGGLNFTTTLLVPEGQTASEKIFCYSADTVRRLIESLPETPPDAEEDDDFGAFDDF